MALLSKSFFPSTQALYSISLRVVTLAVRFSFVFFAAFFLAPSQVGVYGLVTAIVAYIIYFVGCEFYTYSVRELIKTAENRITLIRDQLFFHLVCYLFLLPVFFAGLQSYFNWSWTFVLLILFLIVAEHLAQELNRILIALDKPLHASVILFLRGASWALALLSLMYFFEAMRSVNWILCSWLLGTVISLLIGGYWVLSIHHYEKVALGFNFDWVKRGVLSSIPLFVASLAARGLTLFDRTWAESVSGLEVVGAYVLFISIANAMIAMADTAVVSFQFPSIVSSALKKEKKEFIRLIQKFSISILVIGIVCSAGVITLFPFFLSFMTSPIYAEYSYLMNWSILIGWLQLISLPPHLILYSLSFDRYITYGQVFGLIVFFLAGVFFIGNWGTIMSIIYALSCAYFVILVWKVIGAILAFNNFLWESLS